jgi:hypothetical protein
MLTAVFMVREADVGKLSVGEPSTVVITYLYCEKMAVDAMMDAGRRTILLRYTGLTLDSCQNNDRAPQTRMHEPIVRYVIEQHSQIKTKSLFSLLLKFE